MRSIARGWSTPGSGAGMRFRRASCWEYGRGLVFESRRREWSVVSSIALEDNVTACEGKKEKQSQFDETNVWIIIERKMGSGGRAGSRHGWHGWQWLGALYLLHIQVSRVAELGGARELRRPLSCNNLGITCMERWTWDYC